MTHRSVVLITFDIEGLYGNADKQIKIILRDLEKHHAYSTFFFTATYAQESMGIVETILDGGHEISCHGLDHYTLPFLSENEVKQRLERAYRIFTRLCKTSAFGFRAPNFAVNSNIIKIVEMLGFRYDSSILPSIPIPSWYGSSSAPIYPYHPNLRRRGKEDEMREFLEVPLAVFPYIRVPCFGGWWLRNLGETWFRTGIDLLLHRGPATVCLHDWEFLSSQDIKFQAEFRSEHSYPPLAFRNTGAYVVKAFRHLLEKRNSKILSINMAIEKGLL